MTPVPPTRPAAVLATKLPYRLGVTYQIIKRWKLGYLQVTLKNGMLKGTFGKTRIIRCIP
jgi:hypothetical protein